MAILPRVIARITAPLLLLFPFSLVPAASESSGRWSWDASVGYLQRSFENRLGDERLNRHDQQDLRLRYGLNGFIVHPAIARFRVDADALFGKLEGGSYSGTNRIGLGAELGLFPRGAYPTRLYFRRRFYDFEAPATADPFVLLAAPDQGTSWGAHLRAARGPFRNVAIGFERNTVGFVGPATDQTYARQYLTWTRNEGRFRQQLRLNRRLTEGGFAGADIDHLGIGFDQRGDLTPLWNWSLLADGTRRYLRGSEIEPFESRVFRLYNVFQRPVRGDDRLQLSHRMGLLQPDRAPETTSHVTKVMYTWKAGAHWQLSPNFRYDIRDTDDTTLRAPSVGVTVDWNPRPGVLAVWLGVNGGFGNVKLGTETFEREEELLYYGFHGSLAHARARAFQKELEFEASHNELQMDLDPVPGFPDLGLQRRQLATGDSYRARISLGRHWDSSYFTGWGEWRLALAEPDELLEGFERESLVGTLQLGRHRLSLAADLGATTVRNGPQEQEVRHFGANAHWRPWRFLGLRATYRSDLRLAALVRDLDGTRYELGAIVTLGRLGIHANAFEFTQELPDRSERSTRGITWSISTRFDGWLPIYTGTRRRGVIR